MEFCVLGPPQIITEAGTVPLAGHRQLTVLALLLLNRGRIVPLEQLIDAVWEDDPPATAKRQIQNCVSVLRGLLVRYGRNDPIIPDGPGYRIRLEPDELDVQRFEAGVAAATELALDEGRVEEAVAELRSALRLWQGPALAGLTSQVVRAAAARLDEQRLAAAEQCYELELQLGRHDRLVGELTELVAAHPYRERLVGQLMRALHQSGRQAEALETYRRFRTLLAEELGLDPGTALQDLQAEILENGGEAASRQPDRPRPAQLPADVSGFTGRVDRLKELDELLPDPDDPGRDATAVTIAAIVGTAGVGKTALAVRWAHRVRGHFPDGQLYVDLRGYASDAPVRPTEALAQLLLALGIPPERIPVELEPAAGLYRSLLSDRRVLVVLDNITNAEQARPLLPGSPGCLVVVTSRERLTGLVARDGAHRVSLDVLTAGECQTLLGRLLGADLVAREPEATVQLAEACAGLPLALRVAAANLTGGPQPSISAYVAELRSRSRLAVLAADGDSVSAVRNAFDLSYQAIGADEQRLFRLLGLVPGPDVTPYAAGALACVPAPDAERLLDRLAAAHLVEQSAPGRYAFHDLLRQYAWDHAQVEETASERAAAWQRLHDWYLSRTDAAAEVLYAHRLHLPVPPLSVLAAPSFDGEAAALAWLDAERENLLAVIRHAAEHGPRSTACLLADALRGYFWLRMHTVDWADATHIALRAAVLEGDLRAQCAALLSLGDLHFRRTEYDQSIAYRTRALTAATQAGWVHGEAAALNTLGIAFRESGRLQEAAGHFERALELYRAIGSRAGEASALRALAVLHIDLGQYSAASEQIEQALARYREVGARQGESAALEDLGEIRLAQGRLDEALSYLTAALALRRQLGDQFEASTMCALADAHREAGHTEQAIELAQTSASLARDVGDRRVEACALNVLARASTGSGHYRQAVRQHRDALRLSREIGNRYVEAEALLGLSVAHRALGAVEEAHHHAKLALAVARARGFRRLEARAVELIGTG